MKQFILSFAVVVLGVNAAKYPSDLPQCKAGDFNCLTRVITEIVQTHPNGHPGLAIPPLEPLHINAIDISQGGSSPIAVDLHFKDLDFWGVTTAVVTKVVGFEKDPQASKYEVHATIPKVTLTGDYKVNGRVLVLPIQGDGKATLTFEKFELVAKYKPLIVEKKDRKYIQTDKFKLDFETSKMNINLTNLFNGDKALSDNMNVFLNENWRDIFNELKPAVSYAVEEILKGIINRIFGKVPYEQLFLPE